VSLAGFNISSSEHTWIEVAVFFAMLTVYPYPYFLTFLQLRTWNLHRCHMCTSEHSPNQTQLSCPYCKQTRLASTWYQNANYLDQYYPQKIHQNCKKIRFKGTTHGLHFRMVEGYSSCVLYVSYFMMRLIKIFVVVHVLTISYVDVLFS
jgi:hypothetical protein